MVEDRVAIGPDGQPLPLSPAEVQTTMDRIFREGTLLAVLIETREGIAVQVLGEPSVGIVEALEAAARAYRVMLRGQG